MTPVTKVLGIFTKKSDHPTSFEHKITKSYSKKDTMYQIIIQQMEGDKGKELYKQDFEDINIRKIVQFVNQEDTSQSVTDQQYDTKDEGKVVQGASPKA